jgi:hypothetical protein
MKLFQYSMQPYMDESDDFGGGDGFEDVKPENDDMSDEKPAEEPKKEPEAKPAEEPKPETKPEEVPKVKLKYNHEEKEYSLDEVVPLAQKGMNYDKLQEQLNSMKSSPVLSYVEKVAKANNMTVEAVVDAWQKADEQREIEALATRENVPYEIAERLYKTEQKTAQIESMLNTEKQTKAEQEKQQSEYTEFFKDYPDIKPEAIPKEVWDRRAATGKSLSDCMAWNENRILKEENKILKQNAENFKKAPIGGVSTHGSDTTPKDSFLEGFDED